MSNMNEAPSAGGGWYEPKERGTAKRIFGVAFDGQTWANLAYLLLALPLGAIYFALLGAVLTVGGGLLAVLIGLAILVGAMFAWPLVAEFERAMANGMLGTRIDRLPFKQPAEPGTWPLVAARLSSVSTWQSLLYLFLRLPIGIFAFAAGIAGFVLAPFTLTMSLHIINGAAFVVARLTEALLQPWETTTQSAAHSRIQVERMPPAPPASESSTTETEPAVAATPSAPGREGQFYDRAQRTAASITDRVQAVTDELSERARAAARAWSDAGAGRTPGAARTTATAEQAVRATPEEGEPDDDRDGDARREALSRVQVDVVMRQVTVNGEEVELTPKEFDLLALFVQNPARPFSRDELLDKIWRNDYEVTDRTIDTHIQRLRKKLGSAAGVIQTIWGVGYRYQPPRD